MKAKKKKQNLQKSLCLGEYHVKVSGSGMVKIPSPWRKVMKDKLYCALCWEEQAVHLKCFDSRADMIFFLQGCRERERRPEDARVLSCSVHRVLPFLPLFRLPEEFRADGAQEMVLVGCLRYFEVWRKEEWEKNLEDDLDTILLDSTF